MFDANDELVIDSSGIVGVILSQSPNLPASDGISYVVNKLNPGDELHISGNNVVGATVSNSSLSLSAAGISGLPDMELHLGTGAGLQLAGLSGIVDNLIIVGTEGNMVEILPTAMMVSATISIAGDIAIDVSTASSFTNFNFVYLNMVGEVKLHLSPLPELPASLVLGGALSAQITTANGVIIHVPSAVTYGVQVSQSSGNTMNLLLSNLPIIPPSYNVDIHQNKIVYLEPTRIRYQNASDIWVYICFICTGPCVC